MSRLEIALSVRPNSPQLDIASVVQAEEEGFDAVIYGDSQNRFADPFVRMAAASQVTSRIKLLMNSTNPVTRHPALAACLAASVHVQSGGRHVIAFARGDSSLTHIGIPTPVPLREFGAYVEAVKAYLRGEAVDCNGFPSRLLWLPAELPPVPIEITATGPKVIAYAATVADRVSFSVGAAPERIGWALEVARAAIAEAGRDPADVSFGAYVNVAVDEDVDRACELMRPPTTNSAHFSAMKDTRIEDHPAILRRVTEPLRQVHLGRDPRRPADLADSEWVRWWGVVGPGDYVVERLRKLVSQGLDYLHVLNGNHAETAFTSASRARLAAEVLPALRRAV